MDSGCPTTIARSSASLRRGHPLGGHRVVRLAARLGGGDQPARADAHRQPAQRARRAHRTSSPCRRATSPATGGARRQRSWSAPGRSTSGSSWHAEVAAARRLRGDAEAASRDPVKLVEFRAAARSELGAAGAPALAAKTEQLRERWVRDRLVEAGRARAASVGWPDAYAFTKALGEQALTDSKGAVPVSIVRPSIIESAWAEPRPGWIRGFRMAEPVLISYARGLLREFPGVPEGIVDVIPVDLVVAAIISRRRARPRRGAADHAGRVRRHQPAEVPRARRQRQRLVHRAPAVRPRGPADRGAGVPLPRLAGGSRVSSPGPSR